MNEELQKWHSKLALEVNSMHRLHATVIEMKENGITKDQAYELLESLREQCATDDQENNVLDVMDYVVGWCIPEKRIWE